MDWIEIMRTFVGGQPGSFTRAATALELAPSTVTKPVARFKHMIGKGLIDRTTRRVKPTADGDRSFSDTGEDV